MTCLSRWISRGAVWGGAACFALGCVGADTNASRFGFTGPEIFPIENLISGLNVADLDGDGLNDIVVANNARSRLSLLYNQTGQTNSPAKPRFTAKLELNELPPDARFRIESIASEKRIFSLVVEDLDGDGRPDIGYYGEPRELVVLFNKGTNGWSAPKRWPLDDGQLSPNGLCAGDLNADGRTDLVLRTPDGKSPAEFNASLTHKRGALAAARTENPQKASSASQFYIVQPEKGTHFLDNNYTVYGMVTEGLDVIDKIASVPKDQSDRPLKDVKMTVKIVD